jgi:HlyD family secretion protein
MSSTGNQPVKGKKKRRKSTIVIWVLIGIIVLMLAAGGYLYQQQKQVAAENASKISSQMTRNVKVEQGLISENLEEMSGTVRSNQSISLNWKISGTVSDVYVQPGDQVKKGDILAALDPATIDTSILDAAVTKEDAQEQLERLYTSSLDLATAYNTMITAQDAVKTAEDALSALGVVREDEIEIGVYYQDYLNAKSAYESALDNYNTLKVRPLDDVDRQRASQRLESARSAMESALSMYNWYNGEVDSLEKQQAEADVILKKAQYDDAVRAYNKIKDGPTESQVKSLEAQVKSAEATVNTAYIIAPIDGTVAEVASKQFDVITLDNTTDEVLAIRLEDLSSYSIDVSVSEMDVNSVEVGQTAEITFDAVPLKMFTGKIVSISNVGDTSGEEVTYALTIRMDDTDPSVRPGMMADIQIRTKEAADALIVPKTAVGTTQDGSQYVEKVNQDGTTTRISVTTGISSDENIQILSDQIQAGDEVRETVLPDMSQNAGATGAGGLFSGMPIRIGGGAAGGGAPREGGQGGPPPDGGGGQRP